jgi:RNA polymerase sigma factor (sigma-70 family)
VTRTRDEIDLKHIRTLFNLGVTAGLTDGQLLNRFADRRGEEAELAFAALVERHGPMVLRACRGILGDGPDTQDAFQATFLILVRRGGSLWVRDSLGPWLHRVACRVAIRVRRVEERRGVAERRAAELAGHPTGEAGRDERGEILHEEIDRLPERYRVPIVICELEGHTYEEAAQHLGCPVGTIKSRLARGRERLRERLTRRGLAPRAGLLAAAHPTGPPHAAMPAHWVDSTIRAAMALAAREVVPAGAVTATVQVLTEEVQRIMAMNKMRLVTFALLAGGIVAAGATLVARQRAGAQVQNDRPNGAARQGTEAVDPATRREAALRPHSVENLKTIALALHDYRSARGAFPPAQLLKPGDKIPYSWRVAILPYIGQRKLYEQYKFDEPWDGPNNRKLLEKIPAAFRAPGDADTSTNASYFVLTGPGAVFSGSEGTTLDAIRDGASTTILLVESKRPVPWTKPEDIPFTADHPLPTLGGYYDTCAGKGAFHAAFADGGVRLISGTMREGPLRALISKAGGEEMKLP